MILFNLTRFLSRASSNSAVTVTYRRVLFWKGLSCSGSMAQKFWYFGKGVMSQPLYLYGHSRIFNCFFSKFCLYNICIMVDRDFALLFLYSYILLLVFSFHLSQ